MRVLLLLVSAITLCLLGSQARKGHQRTKKEKRNQVSSTAPPDCVYERPEFFDRRSPSGPSFEKRDNPDPPPYKK